MAPRKKHQKSNDELAADYEAKLAEHEERQKVKGRIFDPMQLVARADRLITVDHPVLGQLKFGELTFEDALRSTRLRRTSKKLRLQLGL